jgi:hypothetical protein
MSTINWTGAWAGTDTYNVGDAVYYLGSSYIAVANNTNIIPSSNESAWNLLASQGSVGPAGAAGMPGAPGAPATSLTWTTRWGGISGTISDQQDLEIVLSSKADTSSVPTKTSELINDAGFVTSASVAPVQSVAGKRGDVTLVPGDIGGLADVATSGSFADLSDKPTIPTVPTDVSAFVNDAGYITAAQAPAQVNADWNASSGKAAILNKPTLFTAADIAAGDNVIVTPSGNGVIIAATGGGGGSTEAEWGSISGTLSNQADLETALNAKADTSSLATVSTSGSYSDLSDKPTIPTVPTDVSAFTNNAGYLTASSTVPASHVTGLAPVATSGNFADLTGKPSIPTVPADVSAFINDAEYITASGAPVQTVAGRTGTVTLAHTDISGLSEVAHSGAYSDLTGTPSIPAAQVQSDWNASSGVSEILNKPTIPTVPGDFTASAAGLAPASGGGTTNFLRADGAWAAPPSGSGTSPTTTILLDVSVGNGNSSFGQVIGPSFTALNLPNVNTDTANGYDSAASTYTIPVTGDYLIVSKMRLLESVSGTNTGVNYGQGVNTVLQDGTYFAWFATADTPKSAANRNGAINTRIARFTAGDQLQMFAYVDFGTGMNVSNAGLNIVFLGS